MKKDDASKKRKLPTIDHGIDIVGDEWDEEDEEINTDILQNEEDWENEGGVTLPHVDDNTPREELDSWTKTTAKATAKGIAAKEATYVDESTQLFWWESIGT